MPLYYFELRAVSQIELTEVDIMNHFMQVVHKILFYDSGAVGLSFPSYAIKGVKKLGGVIRFFGKKERLSNFYHDLKSEPAIRDYGFLSQINLVPDKRKAMPYLCVSRVRVKGQSDLRRAKKRLLSQGKWTEEVESRMCEKWNRVHLNYPYCRLKSTSTGQFFTLWIKQEWCYTAKSGIFNSYGMSNQATVPNF